MNPTLRNILAVVAAIIFGGVINYGIVSLGHGIFPIPEGVDPTKIESIRAHLDLYSFKDFIMPTLAHAIGTLSGAYLVSRIAASNYKTLALIIGGFFFLGGAYMAYLLPEFWKFSIIDLVIAYFPMAILGWQIAGSPE